MSDLEKARRKLKREKKKLLKSENHLSPFQNLNSALAGENALVWVPVLLIDVWFYSQPH